MRSYWVIIVLLLVANLSLAERSRGSSRRGKSIFLNIDAGATLSNINSYYSVTSGNRSNVAGVTGFFRVRPGFRLLRGFTAEPSLGWVFPWRTGEDGSVNIYTTQLSADFAYRFLSWMKVRIGPGLQWELISSQGQTVTLNNGGGTSDFYLADSSTSAFTLTANLSFEFLIVGGFSLGTDFYVLAPLDSESRDYKIALMAGYQL